MASAKAAISESIVVVVIVLSLACVVVFSTVSSIGYSSRYVNRNPVILSDYLKKLFPDYFQIIAFCY